MAAGAGQALDADALEAQDEEIAALAATYPESADARILGWDDFLVTLDANLFFVFPRQVAASDLPGVLGGLESSWSGSDLEQRLVTLEQVYDVSEGCACYDTAFPQDFQSGATHCGATPFAPLACQPHHFRSGATPSATLISSGVI